MTRAALFLLRVALVILLFQTLHCQFCLSMSMMKFGNSQHLGIATLKNDDHEMAVMLPGDPMVTGVVSQGIINGISIYSNFILARST